jgi:hypothetical protein
MQKEQDAQDAQDCIDVQNYIDALRLKGEQEKQLRKKLREDRLEEYRQKWKKRKEEYQQRRDELLKNTPPKQKKQHRTEQKKIYMDAQEKLRLEQFEDA